MVSKVVGEGDICTEIHVAQRSPIKAVLAREGDSKHKGCESAWGVPGTGRRPVCLVPGHGREGTKGDEVGKARSHMPQEPRGALILC